MAETRRLNRPKAIAMLEKAASDPRLSPELREQSAISAHRLRKLEEWKAKKLATPSDE